MSDTIGHKPRDGGRCRDTSSAGRSSRGSVRYATRSIGVCRRFTRKRGVEISERTVGHLLNRYDEVLAVSLTDSRRLREQQGRVILAVDGLQPDVGHEVLWVVRECVSGEIMLARSMLSAATEDFAGGGAGWAKRWRG